MKARALNCVMAAVIGVFVTQRAPALADDALPPIRAFDIPTVEALGRAMYEQDQLAWKATDDLLAHVPHADIIAKKGHGWIVETTAKGNLVRFVRDTGTGPAALYDVAFDASGAIVGSGPAADRLNADEKAQYDARNLAQANIAKRCSTAYNTVALKDPQGDGWLVWAMPASTDPHTIVMGIHYRFTISADGTTVRARDALTKECAVFTEQQDQPHMEAFMMEQLVSLMPLETQVFTSLSYKLPIDVGMLDGTIWKIDGAKIDEIGPDSPGADGAAARGFAGESEQCKVIATNPQEKPAKYYLQNDTKVIAATEKAGPFHVDTQPGFQAAAISCIRLDIVPAPNDYKVLATGLPLYIMDHGRGHDERLGSLSLVRGQFQFAIVKGTPLTPALETRLQARLNQLQMSLQQKS